MPKGVTDGVFLPVPPHHVFLKLHWVLWSFSSFLQFVQGHIVLPAKGTPRLLQEMCLAHSDDALVHWLYQRRGVGREVDELDVLMQLGQQMGVGRSVVQDHGDLEREALRPAILSKLVYQLGLGVCLENVACHPPTAVGIPVDGQAVLIVAPKGTRVLGVVHQDELELAVYRQVRPQQEGETVLERLEAFGKLLFLGDVTAFRQFFSIAGPFHPC